MAGLIDSTTGLDFGTGLQFQTAIGGSGLQINALSGAALLLANETNGLAIDFSDLSMVIKDTGTPANAFSGNPNSKLTYSSPSTKWVLGVNGLYSSGTTLRTEYDTSGTALGCRIEEARTNVVLQNRDLSNAAWTKTNCTADKDQIGIDGVTNSASSITATAGNATCLQAITLGSSARYQSAFIKRITGSGTIEMTMDNGTTWTAVSVTSSWAPVEIPTQTLANPTVGFRIATSGDAVAIDMVQNENGTFRTSPISTVGSTVTRAVDQVFINKALFPVSTTGLLLFGQFIARGLNTGRYICFGNASQTNYFEIAYNASNQVRGASDGTNGIAIANVTSYTSGTIKAAISAKLNESRMSVNGVALTADTLCTVPTPDNLYMSGRIQSFGAMNSPIQKVMLLPRAAVDQAELTALTV